MSTKFPAVAAVIDTADFSPSYEGEAYVTVTCRCPRASSFPAGVWELTPIAAGRPDWSIAKSERARTGGET